jgi:hypothetical protein
MHYPRRRALRRPSCSASAAAQGAHGLLSVLALGHRGTCSSWPVLARTPCAGAWRSTPQLSAALQANATLQPSIALQSIVVPTVGRAGGLRTMLDNFAPIGAQT